MSERPSIYVLTQAARDLVTEGMGGFDDDAGMDEWLGRVDAWVGQAGDKYVACRAVLARAADEAEFLRAEAAKLNARAVLLDRTGQHVTSLVETLLREHLELKSERKVTTADGSWVKLQDRKTEAVLVDDESALPEQFVRVKREPNKVAIKEALKAGGEVPGARLEERTSEFVKWGQ